MCNYIVTDEEIEKAEKDIFKNGEHFNDEQKIFLKCLDSCCVQAYAGTGKTSTIVGKLHILAQKNVWQNGRGICVISHTNVAVDEIKKHVAKHYPSIMEYPNFIGTIQEFVNKFLFIPYLSSKGLGIKFQDETRPFNYKLDFPENIVKRIDNYIVSKINHSQDYERARKDFFERLKTVYIYENKLYARKKYDGFTEYTDLTTKKVSQETISNSFKSLINKKHKDGFFTFIESFIYGLEYLNQNKNLIKIIKQRFQFVFLDEAQDCSEIQVKVLKELFGDDSKTVFQQIGDINQAISETIWNPSEPIFLGKSERFKTNLASFINKFKIDGGLGVVGQPISNPSEKVKLFLIKYNFGKECDVLKFFAEKLKAENIPMNRDFFAICHKHEQLLKYFNEYNEILAKNQNKKTSTRFNSDFEYLNLITKDSIQKRGSNFVSKTLLSLLYKHFKIEGGSWNNLKEYLTINNKIDIFKKIVLEICTEILTNNNLSNLDSLKDRLNGLIESNEINFISRVPLNTSVITQNNNKKNIFIDNGVSINIGTIHSVKGQTHNATLYFSNKEYDKNDIEHALLKNNNSRTLEFKRYLYVASSRPKYLFAFAIENSVFDKLTDKTAFQDFSQITL